MMLQKQAENVGIQQFSLSTFINIFMLDVDDDYVRVIKNHLDSST